MARLHDSYTRYPRTLLWLVRGGTRVEPGQEGDTRRVQIDSFYLSKSPVTNQQFEAFDPGYLRAATSPGDDQPAVGVSFHEACDYCAWYGEVARKPMRLPTAREWCWACAGGTDWPPASELDEVAWHAGNSGAYAGRLPPLAAKRHNPAGLYGMLGGVWDWTSTPVGQAAGAEGGAARLGAARRGERRSQCGGSFRTSRQLLGPDLCRGVDVGARLDDVGFRVLKPMRVQVPSRGGEP